MLRRPPGTTGQISGATGTGDIEFTVRLSGPPAADLHALLDVVFATEAALREVLAPDKVNLASLGNVVPHLHWHVIPRFSDDPHFPNAVWGERKRDTPHGAAADVGGRLAAVLTRRLGRARETG